MQSALQEANKSTDIFLLNKLQEIYTPFRKLSSFSLFVNAFYKINLANTSKVRAGDTYHCHVAK